MTNNTSAIDDIHCYAKSHLAQIAATRYILKVTQDRDKIKEQIETIINNPEGVGFVSNILTKETKELFANFESYYRDHYPEYDPGHLFNQSTVLLADAVLHKYLKNIYKELQPVKGWTIKLPNSLTGQIQVLFVGKNDPDPIKCRNPLLVYNGFFAKFHHVMFLDQIRHVVIHNQGVVDDSFYRCCGIDPVSGNPIPSNPGLWGLPSDWNAPFFVDNLQDFKAYFEIGKQIHLPIDKVFGLLAESFTFIDDVHAISKNELT